MSRFHWTVLIYLASFNILAAWLASVLLKRNSLDRPSLIWLVRLWPAVMCALLALQLAAPDSWRPFLRTWLYGLLSTAMFWNLIVLGPVVLSGICLLLVMLGRDWRDGKTKVKPTVAAEGITRRNFIQLTAAGAAPAVALGFGLYGTLTRNDLLVRRQELAVPGLPPDLEGVTITHLSDLHSGVFCGPDRLRIISDAANDLKSDLVAVTGDVMNNSVTELPAAMEALKRIETRQGMLVCEGNHDRYAAPGALDEACRDAGMCYLSESRTTLKIRGCTLQVSGIPWPDKRNFKGQGEVLRGLYPETKKDDELRILLAHHPDFFDWTGDVVDVMLSGHTHGGQLMMGPIGLGPLYFKYWSGLYRRDKQTLVVSNGCGDWFPCRVGAPAEIVQLILRRS